MHEEIKHFWKLDQGELDHQQLLKKVTSLNVQRPLPLPMLHLIKLPMKLLEMCPRRLWPSAGMLCRHFYLFVFPLVCLIFLFSFSLHI